MTIRTILLAGLLLTAGCASTPDLVGSWRLVQEGVPETTLVKTLSETHFAFGEQHGFDVWAGGGTWSLDGDTYVEHVEWHSNPDLVGRVIRFSCVVKDGRWYHAADFVVDGRPYHVEEVWERIRPGRSPAERAARH